MADSINKYASEAEYNSASHGSTPEVSKVSGSATPVRYDGMNTDTTGSPSVGDAVYLDPDDNVRFISWKNLVPGALGNGWYPVGVVINRFGRNVRIRYKNYKAYSVASAMFYKLSSQTSNNITFQVPSASQSTTLVELGATFTASKSLASDPSGFISELDSWLRLHQPGKNGNPGMILNWHAEYINNIPWLVCDCVNNSNINLACTGMTATITTYFQPQTTYFMTLPIKCGCDLDHGIIFNADAMIARGAVRTPTSTVNLSTPGDPVTEDAFNNNEYCTALRAKYSTYMDYVCDRTLRCPTKSHAYFTALHNKSYQLSHDMASCTFPNIDGVTTNYFQMCVWANAPDTSSRSAAVNASFKWYMPGVIEGYEYCCDRGTTMDDPVWSTMGKISDNQNTLASIRTVIGLNSYKNDRVYWRMYGVSNLSYGGGTRDPFYTFARLSFADYDLTGRT